VIRVGALLTVVALTSVAQEHLHRGLRFYDTQRYDEAIAEFRDGYALDPDPQFLYALGQAERKKGDCPAAVEAYRAYRRQAPAERQARAAEEQIARCLAASPVLVAPMGVPAVTAPGVTSPPARRRLWTWLGVGFTGAALASAAVVEIVASRHYDDLQRTCAPPAGPGCSNAAIDSLSREINAATGLFVTAGALGAAMVIAIVLESRNAR
jgi:tetratricopeptide (TPR) repeat protein